MCVNSYIRGQVFATRDRKSKVVCTKTAEEDKPTVWAIMQTSNDNYKVGQWFIASMGHALPCKNPKGDTETQRGCRLHALDAVTYDDDINDNVLAKLPARTDANKLVPNLDLTDMVAINAPASVTAPTAPTKKKLSVMVVSDPQVNKVTKAKAKVVNSGWKSQKRDSTGRFLSKAKVVLGQKRDRNGRFV